MYVKEAPCDRMTDGHLGAAFAWGKKGTGGIGKGSKGGTDTANRYKGTSCPPGQSVVSRETEQHAPAYAGGPTRTDYVFCQPAPSAGPAPAADKGAEVSPTITVSPTFQQQFTPQISPVFQQAQDSPGSTQAATPVQSAPGGQEAKGGGAGADSSELLEFMRESEAARQREAEQRRQAEAAAREAERQEQAAAAAAEAERRRQAEAEREAERAAELEAMQAQLERAQQPPQTVYTPGAPPTGRRPSPAPAAAAPVEEGAALPVWLIPAAGAALVGLVLIANRRTR